MNADPRIKNQQLLDLLRSKLGAQLLESTIELGDAVVKVAAGQILDFFKLVKIDSELKFDMLLSVTAIDWMDNRENRFEMVYHLLSTQHLFRLRIKSELSEKNPEIDSISNLWAGANFMEREVWDMYGIKFKGHSDLRRILMYDEFVGHPLRKDYPVQGKQPRIPLRAPEVSNTARDMKRSVLVKIGTNKKPGVPNGTPQVR